MAKLLGRLVALVEWWAVLLLAGLAVLVCLGVFFRYVLNASLTWYDEFASYMLVWLTFYGTVVADYRRRHIGFDLLVDKLAPPMKSNEPDKEAFIKASAAVYEEFGKQIAGGSDLIKVVQSLR